ncbi:putative reverse transcriptase domain-containing protein, partial [Tanacetum coccineum]
MGAGEARQDPNIVTGTFTLDNHYATTLFDSGADYSFVSTTFMPLHKAEIVCHEKVVKIPLPNGKILRVLGERPEEKVRHSKSAKVKEQKLKDIVVVKNFSESRSLPIVWRPLKWRSCRVNSENSETRVSFDKVHHPGEHRLRLELDMDVHSNALWFDKCISSIHGLDEPNSSKIEVVKNWEAPRTPSEVRSFLGLTVYYRRFIENFFKIAKPRTILTQKHKEYIWGDEQERAFQTLKDKLCNAPVLALPDGSEDFVVYCDASGLGL